MHIPLLNDIVIVFALAVCVILLCHKINIPVIVGYLATGIMAGPFGFGLISNIKEVDALAEIGIVLLLFTIGLEFSFRHLLKIKKNVLLGGSLQVSLTAAFFYFIERVQGLSFQESLFTGILLALSSTAIALKLIQERAEMDTHHGKTTFAILIFQDIIIIPIMLFIPLLGGEKVSLGNELTLLLGKGALIIVLLYVSAKWLVPFLLYQITRTRIKELFLLSIFTICLLIVWLTASAGVSLALGAFLAGLIISESEYSHEALGNILPFKDIFLSFFFISVGMLLDINFFLNNPVKIIFFTLGLLIVKMFVGGVVTLLLQYPLRTAVMVGFTLSQVGEFSFMLLKMGQNLNILNNDSYQTLLSVSILTMSTTAFVMTFAPTVSDILLKFPLPERLKFGLETVSGIKWTGKKNHLIIIGYGLNGRNLSNACVKSGIPYAVIEMNPTTVKKEKAKGVEIFYGDAVQEAVLHHANAKMAKIAVIAISDPPATRRIIKLLRKLNPEIYIIVRTKYLNELKPLYALGANEIIPEEFETSIEIFTRVLLKYLVPREEVEKFTKEIRADSYQMFRDHSKKITDLSEINPYLSGVEISSYVIHANSKIVNKKLSEIKLNSEFEVAVIAILRDKKTFSNPNGSAEIKIDDRIFLMGKPEKIDEVVKLYNI